MKEEEIGERGVVRTIIGQSLPNVNKRLNKEEEIWERGEW